MKQIIIIGERYTALLKNKLNTLGLTVLPLPDNPDVSPDLAGHTDLSVFCPNGNDLFLAGFLRNTLFAEALEKRGFRVRFIREQQSPVYPADVPLNAKLLCGRKVLLNRKTVSKDILEYFEPVTQTSGFISEPVINNAENTETAFSNKDYEIIGVNQGYAACAALDCGKGIITSDNGIFKASQSHGLNVLKICQGHISLPGYSYGFIGGSALLLGDKMLFTGSLRSHPDKDRILSFLSELSLEPFFLTDEKLFDIGGAIFFNASF